MKLEIFLVLLLGFVNGAKILVWPAEWSHWINMKVRSLNSYPGIHDPKPVGPGPVKILRLRIGTKKLQNLGSIGTERSVDPCWHPHFDTSTRVP